MNQQRLETYFSAVAQPTFDIAAHFTSSRHGFARRPSGASGTNTPRDLQSNVKLLELYTLHVLPRNGEWNYAREFIMMSEVLDEERKEAFIQALHGLKEDQDKVAQREQELKKQQKEQLEEQRKLRESQIAMEAIAEDEARKREDARKHPQRPPDPSTSGISASNPMPRTVPESPPGRADTGRPSRAIPNKKSQVSKRRENPPVTLYKRAAAALSSLQNLIMKMGQGLANNPTGLLRLLLFLLVFAVTFGRKEIRERARRILSKVWEKVAATVGMGTKVSYI